MMTVLHALRTQQAVCILSFVDGCSRRCTASHLVVWVAEMLDLCLGKLPHAQQPLPRGDLVPIGLPYLGRRKGQLVAIVVVQIPAVQYWKRACCTAARPGHDLR